MKYVIGLLIFVGAIFLAVAFEWPASSVSLVPQTQNHSSVSIGSTTISVEVVDTYQERMQGLSGRTSLAESRGMLFVFEEEGNWGIWMKDMRFPLDIIWADSEGNIITIARDVAPETYPNAFYSKEPRARYVLEVPAGFTKMHGIAEGMMLRQN